MSNNVPSQNKISFTREAMGDTMNTNNLIRRTKTKSTLRVRKSRTVMKTIGFTTFVWVKIFCIRIKQRAEVRKMMYYKQRKAPSRKLISFAKTTGQPFEPNVEPTFRMQPRVEPKMGACKKIIDNYLNAIFQDKEYDFKRPWVQRRMSIIISEDIKDEIRAHNLVPERYRVVVWALVGQKNRQGMQVASRSLSDTLTDRFVECKFENKSLVVIVTFYCFYYE